MGDGVPVLPGQRIVVHLLLRGVRDGAEARLRPRRQAVGAFSVGRLDAEIDVVVGVGAGEGRRDVVDVATLVVAVDHPADRQAVGQDRHVQHRGEGGRGIAVGLHAIGRVEAALIGVELRLLGDVAHRSGFGAAAEQRALGAFQHFHALDVGQVEVDVARRELHGLLVQIDRHVGEVADRGAGLVAGETRRQAAHEDVALARAVLRELDIGGDADQIVEGGDVSRGKLGAREGLDGHRHALDALHAPLGGDDQLLDRRTAGAGGVGGRGL